MGLKDVIIVCTFLILAISFAEGWLFSRGPRGAFTQNCMKCICEVEGCERNVGRCRWDVNSYSCGPYQIKEDYYTDCHSPGGGWRECTKQMQCSETCVKSYMNRYGQWCKNNYGGGGRPSCMDYAKVHNGGPRGCSYTLSTYVSRMTACCNRKGGCD